MADKVGSSADVNSVMETIPHQDKGQTNNKRPLLFLPPLPRLPSTASPPSDQAYLRAAAIFQRLRPKKKVPRQQLLHYGKQTDPPEEESADDLPTQRQAYQLAFDTLKYQDLLEDMIADSCFQITQHIPGDLLPLAMVMLCDFQDQRFKWPSGRSTQEGEEPLPEIRDLERSLQRCKTKLAASLARCRVKQNLRSVSCFLSDPVRAKQHRAKRLPIYAWVNTLKTSVEEACGALQSAGLCAVQNVSEIRERTFCRDPRCVDTLVFSTQLRALLQRSSLTSMRALNIQDRSVCVAVTVLRPLLFESRDVLVVGSFSALTVAHVAVAATARSGRVLVCAADHTPAHLEETQELLTQMDITNVRFLSEAFGSLDEGSSAVQRLKVVLVLPQCSSTALNDPVSTIHSEHGDVDLLPELSHGSVSKGKIHTMATQQARLLAHAVSFPKVQTVVYCTRSVHPEENEQLVKTVLEKAHTPPKLLPFRVNGPIFPPDEPQTGAPTADCKFFRLQASQLTNGCFVARLSRQADPTKVETVQDVLARAAAKGLLGGIIPEQSKPKRKGKGKKNHRMSTSPAGSRPLTPSSEDDGQTGTEQPVGGQDHPPALSEHDGHAGECSEEEEKRDEGGENGQKKRRRGLKGRKVKQRRHGDPAAESKHPPDGNGGQRRPAKRSQLSRRRRTTKGKARRRIPRLTLNSMSSADPSSHLSPMAALAHRLNQGPPAVEAGVSPTPSGPRALASKQAPRQNTHAEKKKTQRDAGEPESLFKVERGRGKGVLEEDKEEGVVATQVMWRRPVDLVLPPITCPPSSPPPPSSTPSSHRPSGDSSGQLGKTSASSSSSTSVFLPGL